MPETEDPGPSCVTCGAEAVVNWRRRPTAAEVAEIVAAEQDRRAALLTLADPQAPPPEFGPLPTGADMTRTLYACATHAITLEGAALIHQSKCTAPMNTAKLPGCNCTPEATVQTPPGESSPPSQLPDHWMPGT